MATKRKTAKKPAKKAAAKRLPAQREHTAPGHGLALEVARWVGLLRSLLLVRLLSQLGGGSLVERRHRLTLA